MQEELCFKNKQKKSLSYFFVPQVWWSSAFFGGIFGCEMLVCLCRLKPDRVCVCSVRSLFERPDPSLSSFILWVSLSLFLIHRQSLMHRELVSSWLNIDHNVNVDLSRTHGCSGLLVCHLSLFAFRAVLLIVKLRYTHETQVVRTHTHAFCAKCSVRLSHFYYINIISLTEIRLHPFVVFYLS